MDLDLTTQTLREPKSKPFYRIWADRPKPLRILNKFKHEFGLVNPNFILWKWALIFKFNNENSTTLIRVSRSGLPNLRIVEDRRADQVYEIVKQLHTDYTVTKSYYISHLAEGVYLTLKDKNTKVVNVLCLYFVY